MADQVTVNYSNYSTDSLVNDITFELIEDIALTLKYDDTAERVSIRMADTITDNTELEGQLDYEKLCTLIKGLSQLKNQLKEKVSANTQRRRCCK